MTREEIINEIKCLLSELDNGEDAVSYLTRNDVKWLNENIKALDQLPKLQNRCFALTQGQMCMFCPYDCENRTTEYRSEEA